jgi:hypothetical protein
MKECPNCERLKQRVAELNSELLVLKIAAFAANAGVTAGKQSERPSSPAKRSSVKQRSGEQPPVS